MLLRWLVEGGPTTAGVRRRELRAREAAAHLPWEQHRKGPPAAYADRRLDT